MSCPRNRIMGGVEQWLTAKLEAEFGPGKIATRNLSVDPSGVMPEATPMIFLWEGNRTLYGDPMLDTSVVRLEIIGVVRTSSENSGLIQEQLNEMEAIIDELLFVGSIDGLAVEISLSDEGDTTEAGDSEGWLSYPVIVRFHERRG